MGHSVDMETLPTKNQSEKGGGNGVAMGWQ